ncbi:thermonuclease family protein [Sulfitobacter guttiformis]|uniref:Nuclease-like protein n=1 Tax=Sulfitobacter guttiformis TaxID=74349 RepID=A0A420DJZ9_9RHOB|nr:thermonuclease family protein [Sulfitobacter guttiformis]KIN71654.1 Nuclease-like protein [Sulfitobacter guttiformis KCTC 32187]RKE94515.1 nuclease-like protein [Sulfitobacter guttiformis]
MISLIIVAYHSGSEKTDYSPKRNYKLDTEARYRRPYTAKDNTIIQKPRTIEGAPYVIDGDTIVIKKTQIRLFGIDAPEINHPHGKNAKWAMVALCKGQTIRAQVSDQDAHGRTVARCYLPDGRDLSAEMVKQGMAIDWPKFSGGIYREMELPDVRKKLWLADARQKGKMHVWEKFDARQKAGSARR